MDKTITLAQALSICSAKEFQYEEFACEKCELKGKKCCAKEWANRLEQDN